MESKHHGISEDAEMHEFMGEKPGTSEEAGLSDPNHVELQRALKARHITMIGMVISFQQHNAQDLTGL